MSRASTADGMSVDRVHEKLSQFCLALPHTNETLTWGKPHFRVGEKIFCSCGEDRGKPLIGLKMESRPSEVMMRLPGIVKASYSCPGDGWVSIDPNVFDDWDEIEQLLIGSYRLVAPKRLVDKLDSR